MSRFGARTRQVRERLRATDRRYSLRQVAGRIGVEPAYLSKIERGAAAPPSEATTRRLAAELGQDPDVFLAMAGKVSSDLQEIIRKRRGCSRTSSDSFATRRTRPSSRSCGWCGMGSGDVVPGKEIENTMITIEHDGLAFRFPSVHRDAACRIEFQRTLRIPDDDRTYPLPPGLGCFPLRHLDDFADRFPEDSVRRGGVVIPMHQAEALWISFIGGLGASAYPCAIKIATGKVCTVSGEPWEVGLTQDPQNYLVVPGQPWLDGYCIEKGTIRQFVAMPLGEGYSTEEQLTGEAEHGGLQLAVYPMRREVYEELPKRKPWRGVREGTRPFPSDLMGVAPGGRMAQQIYRDIYGLDAWDRKRGTRCFVTLANSRQWVAITGERPPTEPPAAEEYARAGLPWFLHYDRDRDVLEGAERLGALKTVADTAQAKRHGEVRG